MYSVFSLTLLVVNWVLTREYFSGYIFIDHLLSLYDVSFYATYRREHSVSLLTVFSQHGTIYLHPCHCKLHYVILSYSKWIFHYVYILVPLSSCLFMDTCVVSRFCLLWIVCCSKHRVQEFSQILDFWQVSILFFKIEQVDILHSTNSEWWILFLHINSNTDCVYDVSVSLFWFLFLWWWNKWHFFHTPLAYLYIFFKKLPISYPYFKGLFLLLSFTSALCSRIITHFHMSCRQIFSPSFLFISLSLYFS